MLFNIKNVRESIEHEYIGFSPSTQSVKPVHLANGMYRGLLNETSDTTSRLFRFVFAASKKDGTIPNGHRFEEVYEWLVEEGRVELDVAQASIAQFRSTLLKIVAADKPSAVTTTGMESYSAGFSSFVSNDRIAQDAGEFLALWLKRQSPEFAEMLIDSIKADNDPITVLAKPLFGTPETAKMQIKNPESIRCLQDSCPQSVTLEMRKLADAGTRLSRQLRRHPNKLVRLRTAVIFGAFLIVRYMADMEYLTTDEERQSRPAFLLDFSASERSPVRLASQQSYIIACQSITRYYIWMFTDYLRTQFDINDLSQDYPRYGTFKQKDSKRKKDPNEICKDVWQEAINRVSDEQNDYRWYGQAVYDIIALLSEATPIDYFRNIGIRCGLFWPPYNFQTAKHFTPRQDMLDVLIRSVAIPGEILDITTLQDRLWDTFGIVIGGRPDDLKLLLDRGIYRADEKALEENQAFFAQKLSDLNFARLLADGVLEVEVG